MLKAEPELLKGSDVSSDLQPAIMYRQNERGPVRRCRIKQTERERERKKKKEKDQLNYCLMMSNLARPQRPQLWQEPGGLGFDEVGPGHLSEDAPQERCSYQNIYA